MKIKERLNQYPEQLFCVLREHGVNNLDHQFKYAELADTYGVMAVNETAHLLSQKRVVSQRRIMIRARARRWLNGGSLGLTGDEIKTLLNSQGAANRYKYTLAKQMRSKHEYK